MATPPATGPTDRPARPEATDRRVAALRGGVLSLGTSLAIQALNVLTGILIARNLGPVGKGELAAALLWPGLLGSVLSLGLFDALVFFSARLDGRERVLFATVFYCAVGLAALAAGLGWWLMPVFLGHAGATSVQLGRLYLLWIPLNFSAISAMALLRGRLELEAYNLLRAAVIVFTALGLSALATRGRFTVEGALLVYLTANALVMVLAMGVVRWHGWLGFQPDWKLLGPLLGYGLRSHVGNFSSLANQQADQLLISAFLAPFALGIYSVAATLTAGVNLIGSSVQVVAFPLVAALADREEQMLALGRLTRLTLLASALAAAGFALVTPFLIELFFGPSFLPAADVARALLVATVVLSTNQVLGAGLRALGWPLGSGGAESVAAVVTLASLAVLLPTAGLIGAALSSLLAYCTSAAVMLWFLRSRLGIAWTALLLPTRSDLNWGVARVCQIIRAGVAGVRP